MPSQCSLPFPAKSRRHTALLRSPLVAPQFTATCLLPPAFHWNAPAITPRLPASTEVSICPDTAAALGSWSIPLFPCPRPAASHDSLSSRLPPLSSSSCVHPCNAGVGVGLHPPLSWLTLGSLGLFPTHTRCVLVAPDESLPAQVAMATHISSPNAPNERPHPHFLPTAFPFLVPHRRERHHSVTQARQLMVLLDPTFLLPPSSHQGLSSEFFPNRVPPAILTAAALIRPTPSQLGYRKSLLTVLPANLSLFTTCSPKQLEGSF